MNNRTLTLRAMQAWALVEVDSAEAIDVFLAEDDAQRALHDCLRDQPEWRGLLRVEEFELHASGNLN